MTIFSGTRLGPYEVGAPLGAGGMGQVFRARDTRLARNVAIKLLPESVAGDAKALSRFEREARAVAALSHPNILSIFDFGVHDGIAYAVMELLEGETFRELLAPGPVSPRRAVDLSVQVARGLAAAHAKGFVHRDLKPENLFLAADGQVKILDFGLARRSTREPAVSGPDDSTASFQTEPGTVVGTVAYMSPEQVRGEPVETSSDVFSFGVVLYELLTGRQAFRRASAVETMSAILAEDPPHTAASGRSIPPGLQRVVEHCLEKSPRARFQSARDLAFALENSLGSASSEGARTALPPSRRERTAVAFTAGALLLALAVGVLAGWTVRTGRASPPRFTQLTFADGPVIRGRFTQDGRSVVFSEAPEGIRELTFGNPVPRIVLGEGVQVLSVSASNQLAVLTPSRDDALGVCPLAGTLPRTVTSSVSDAAWDPRGEALAILRWNALEYPEGKPVKLARRLDDGLLSGLRFSPDGKRVAMFRHVGWDVGAAVLVVDLASGRSRELTPVWALTRGSVVWRPDGKEIWFSAAKEGPHTEIHAVDLEGKEHLVLSAPADLRIDDIAPDGRALVAQVAETSDVMAWDVGAPDVRRLGIQSRSALVDLRRDGRVAIISDWGGRNPPDIDLYLRSTDGSLPAPLGRGSAAALTVDGKSAYVWRRGQGLFLVPVDGGREQPVQSGGFEPDNLSAMTSTGRGRLNVVAQRGSGFPQLWRIAPGEDPRPVASPFISHEATLIPDPDDRRALVADKDAAGRTRLLWNDLASPRAPLRPLGWSLEPDEVGLRLSSDGRWLYALKGAPEVHVASTARALQSLKGTHEGDPDFWRELRLRPRPAELVRFELETGRREAVPNGRLPADLARCSSFSVSDDGSRMVCQANRYDAQLFLVEGLR